MGNALMPLRVATVMGGTMPPILFVLFWTILAASAFHESEAIEELANEVDRLNEINAMNEKRIHMMEDLEERVLHLESLTRTKVLRSCHELSLHGVTRSGAYEIDPDGEARGEPPIQVFCRFEGDLKRTEILHNADNQSWTIPHCEDEFCARTNYTYTAPMSQIQALIELSDSCSQEIIYDCFLAPLLYNDVYIGAWTDRWGDKQFYFDGANYGSHMCACDTQGSCYGSDTFDNTCNCDNTFEHEWKQDRGFITNKTALPITAFNYGFLVYDVMEAMVHVGRLECSGETAHNRPARSCRDLKLSGHQKSGLYMLEDGDNSMFPMISKCDMEDNGYNEVNEMRLGWMQYSSGPAAVRFAVRNSANYEGPHGSPIKFNETVVNIGNGFNGDTFTAPVDGEYEFSFYSLSTGGEGHHFTIDIVVHTNNSTSSWTMTADNYQFTSIGKTWTQPLMLGDKVFLVLQDGAFYGEDKQAEFSGKLM